jgi:hypothetical protein
MYGSIQAFLNKLPVDPAAAHIVPGADHRQYFATIKKCRAFTQVGIAAATAQLAALQDFTLF